MPAPTATPDYATRHLRIGWWSLLLFLGLGLTLEMMHGFKVGFYLDVTNATRRLMWTLAHAHGALLGLVHVIAALVFRGWPEAGATRRPVISFGLTGASILLPGGFFLGGVSLYSGDPGIGIGLTPVGAACLIVAVVQLGRTGDGATRRGR